MKRILIMALLLSGCVTVSNKEGLKRPDFSKTRQKPTPTKCDPFVIAPLTSTEQCCIAQQNLKLIEKMKKDLDKAKADLLTEISKITSNTK